MILFLNSEIWTPVTLSGKSKLQKLLYRLSKSKFLKVLKEYADKTHTIYTTKNLLAIRF
jgi:hypothetical protein